MACVTAEGFNKTAWGVKLILTTGLAYPESCVSLGYLLMAYTVALLFESECLP